MPHGYESAETDGRFRHVSTQEEIDKALAEECTHLYLEEVTGASVRADDAVVVASRSTLGLVRAGTVVLYGCRARKVACFHELYAYGSTVYNVGPGGRSLLDQGSVVHYMHSQECRLRRASVVSADKVCFKEVQGMVGTALDCTVNQAEPGSIILNAFGCRLNQVGGYVSAASGCTGSACGPQATVLLGLSDGTEVLDVEAQDGAVTGGMDLLL